MIVRMTSDVDTNKAEIYFGIACLTGSLTDVKAVYEFVTSLVDSKVQFEDAKRAVHKLSETFKR